MVDYFKSVSDERQAIVLVQELIAICATGGFKLTKWISNSCSVLTSIPEEERSKDVRHLDLHRVELPVDSALGLQWDTEFDTFLFKITLKQQQFTRRGILSVTNSVYNPLGFLAPVMLPAKRIRQELCRINYGWNEEIPADFAQKGDKWLEELKLLSNLATVDTSYPTTLGKYVVLNYITSTMLAKLAMLRLAIYVLQTSVVLSTLFL